jgi:hypothetical protein
MPSILASRASLGLLARAKRVKGHECRNSYSGVNRDGRPPKMGILLRTVIKLQVLYRKGAVASIFQERL